MSDKLKLAGFGLVFVAMGVFIAVMMTVHPEGARVPGSVVYVCAGAFAFAGLSVVAQALGWAAFARVLGLAVAYSLAVPPLWILVAGQDQSCSASIGFLGAVFQQASAWGCRGIFGFGGLLTLAMALAFTWAAVRRRRTAVSRGEKMSGPNG